MANVDRPNGARIVNSMNGASFQGQVKLYECDSSAANIFPGDFIQMEADGKVAPATAGNTELIGVCVGVLGWMPNKTSGVTDHYMTSGAQPDLSKIHHTTGSAGVILVYVDPNGLYEMQEDGEDSQLALTDIGNNVDILATAGDVATSSSRQEIDSNTVTAATAQLRIVDFVDRVDNEIGSTGARWIVRINESHFNKLAGI